MSHHETLSAMQTFSAEERHELELEDREAAENALTVLLTIVTFGMLLGILAVVLCLL